MNKKYIISTIVTILLILLISCSKTKKVIIEINDNEILTQYEKDFIKVYKLNLQDVLPYKKYTKFNINYYFAYEKTRTNLECTYLQAINQVNYPNYYFPYTYPKNSLLENTDLILVNKSFHISKNFFPIDLTSISTYDVEYIKRDNENMLASKHALDYYQLMYNEAKANNIDLVIFSAYRTYQKQYDLYYNVNRKDDNYSAKPGYSEHHTGLAFDISDTIHGLTLNFSKSKTYKWLINNSYKYGFILRYPQNKENITMYSYEPWHFRYVGIETATKIYYLNTTLEEYLITNIEL